MTQALAGIMLYFEGGEVNKEQTKSQRNLIPSVIFHNPTSLLLPFNFSPDIT